MATVITNRVFLRLLFISCLATNANMYKQPFVAVYSSELDKLNRSAVEHSQSFKHLPSSTSHT